MKISKNKALISDIALLIVAIIWGGGFIAVKDSVNLISPFYQMTLRFSLASLFMVILFFKYLKHLNKNSIFQGIIIGFFMFLGFALQTVGIVYTTASKSAFLTATYVLLVPFFNWLIFKYKPDKYALIGAFICIIGIGMLTLQKDININFGDILTLLCGIGFAAQIIATDIYAKKTEPLSLTIVQFITASILSFIVAIIFEPKPTLSIKVMPSILYLVIFSTMLCFIIQNIAQKYTTASHAAIILSLESVFGSILSIIIFKDKFSLNMILGCLLIFIAIIITETKLSFLKKKY
ncbi:DMT family transporter [Clostridium ihumii]|uniref:DMT family transporter n=1 Tax=Clostridium ihumii TaxID=1470356 RepID=UPI0005570841|nr:DMT family transporter [Clostridium ihumii]